MITAMALFRLFFIQVSNTLSLIFIKKDVHQNLFVTLLLGSKAKTMLAQQCLFVCVGVLRPSQPNRVMSSVVSLPNHMFTGQA